MRERRWILPYILRYLAVLLAIGVLFSASSRARAETAEIRIAQQYGLAYLPLQVMRSRGLLEAAVQHRGLPRPRVTWSDLNSGAAMNDALLSDSVDFVSAGVPPMITLWAKTVGTAREVRGIAAMGSTPAILVSNDPAVKSLADLGPKDRIALPAVKVSIQAVLLQMAAEKAFGGDGRGRFDEMTVGMAHPDGASALLLGRTGVTAHFTTAPYSTLELANPKVHQLLSSYEVMGGPHTLNLVYTTKRFHDANPIVAAAFLEALDQAMALIRSDPAAATAIYVQAESPGVPSETIEKIVRDGANVYDTTPRGVMKFADFQYRTGAIKQRPAGWQALFFPEIAAKGLGS